MRFVYELVCALLFVAGLTSLVGWLTTGSGYAWQGVAYAATAAVLLIAGVVMAMMLAASSPDQYNDTYGDTVNESASGQPPVT